MGGLMAGEIFDTILWTVSAVTFWLVVACVIRVKKDRDANAAFIRAHRVLLIGLAVANTVFAFLSLVSLLRLS